jgi:hypothetical protein
MKRKRHEGNIHGGEKTVTPSLNIQLLSKELRAGVVTPSRVLTMHPISLLTSWINI